jgi:Flp pilus assembly protein TadD
VWGKKMSDKSIFSKKTQQLIIYLLLIVVTLAVYWQINKFDFINFDDVLYITENSIIKSGISSEGFYWAFGSKYFGLWNPLVWISFMLDYQLYDLNAGGYHLTNLILHILSTLLLFRLFHRMTGAVWKSAFVAALFALHPLHVESVAWISERKDVLSAFFWMLTLCCYVYYTEKPMIKRYLLVLFSFVLALMSKPMVITLPVIMMLLDYWPLKRFPSQKSNWFLWQLKEKWPFFFLSLILLFTTFYTPGNHVSYQLLPLEVRLANAPIAFMTYLLKTFWPFSLVVFYPFPAHIPTWQAWGTLLLIISISIFVMIAAKHRPHLFVGWLWFMITIALVIGIRQIGEFSMADRYHYLPSVGIGIMIAWGIPLLFPTETLRNKILFPAAMVFFMILSLLTWQQCGHWKNSIELWQHALNVTDNNYMAHNNLASALLEKGETQQAIYHYDQAIRINKYPAANYNKGVIYFRLGQYQRAILSFSDAIRVRPDYAEVYYNLGIIYHALGQSQVAIKNFNEAIRIMPNHANAYNNRAFIYLNMKNNFAGCSNALKACQLGNCKTLTWAKDQGICN